MAHFVALFTSPLPLKILLDVKYLDGEACPMIISLNLYQPGIIIYNTLGVGLLVLTEKKNLKNGSELGTL